MRANLDKRGYSALSILLHWITAIAIVALFLTHEGDRGSAARAFHVGGGAILGIVILWRVWRRFTHGMAEKPKQPALLNLLSRVVFLSLLGAMAVAVVTGYLSPWSMGAPLDIYGLSIPSPLPRMPEFHEAIEEIHEVAGQLFIPLVALHLLGVAKHWLLDADRLTVLKRMIRPEPAGV